ncbi:MAG: ParA family protein [Acidobacteria bacterium]|nr:ParA family protein [Acidobacteriota bacterium]
MRHTITVTNLKGGVGKTTVVVSLGAVLAQRGYRVLLVDTDSQGHLSISFGLKHTHGLWELVSGRTAPKDVIYKVGKGLFIIPSDRRTVAIEQLLVTARDRHTVLSKQLKRLPPFDVVILDTSPSLSVLLQNALYFSRNILIPVSMDYFAVLGATQSLDLLRSLGKQVGAQCNILGVVPTFVDRRLKITETMLTHIDVIFRQRGIHVFGGIRIDANVRKASARHLTIVDFDQRSRAALDFKALADDLETYFSFGANGLRASQK